LRRNNRTTTIERGYTFHLGPLSAAILLLDSEQIAYMMSTTEKVIDLDSIRQRLDRLGVRL
jgi:hypothetical protein